MADTAQTTEVVITITPEGPAWTGKGARPCAELASMLRGLSHRLEAGWYATLADLPETLADSEDNPVGTIEVRLPPAADPTTWLYHLDRLPTIGDNGTADLRLDNGLTRVWLSRGGTAGGHPFDRTVYVEVLDDVGPEGRWLDAGHFDAEARQAPGSGTLLRDAYELSVQAAALDARHQQARAQRRLGRG